MMIELDSFVRSHLARTAQLPFRIALHERRLPLDSYVGLLRALQIVVPAIERLNAGSSALAPPLSDALVHDLLPFRTRELHDAPAAMLRAALLAQDLKPPADDDGTFGALARYALAASALGQPAFYERTRRMIVAEAPASILFLSRVGDIANLNQRPSINTKVSASALVGVQQVFEGIEDMLGALFPLPSERLRDLVTGLNPDAGTHIIPDDLHEIQAALRAGETSLRYFPYYTERYGERGRRFTHSDSAWLVTLSDLTQPMVDQQLGWLGRVLASRGMPRWMLALHLDVLHDELVRAIPERAEAYQHLHVAAERMHARRCDILDDDALTKLEREFDARVGADLQWRLPHTGALLGAAVADEADGIIRAVVSLESWLTGPALFPAPWIDAVKATLHDARSIAQPVSR